MTNITVAVIPEIGDRFLFIKKYHYDNKLACIAGHVEKGEKLEDAAKREAKEEADIEIKDLKLILNKKLKYICRHGHDWHNLFLFTAKSNEKSNFRSDEGEIVLLNKQEMKNVSWLETTKDFLKEVGYLD